MDKVTFILFVITFVNFVACQSKNESILNEFSRMSRNRDNNAYYVYTRNNPREPVRILASAAGAVAAVNHFRTNTVLLIHDREAYHLTDFNILLKDALLSVEDVSIVVLDWSWGSLWPEELSASAVPEVAAGLAEMLRHYILHLRINAGRLHIIGFGLGAHIAGQASRTLKNLTPISYAVARITGLDPTGGNMWGSNSNRLSFADASFVEVIHTDMSGYGIMDALGHLDFYVNGGINQPGCDIQTDCSHRRSWELFAASLTHNLIGYQCRGDIPIQNNCRGFIVPVGKNDLVKYGSGMFFVESTSATYPYAKSGDCLAVCD